VSKEHYDKYEALCNKYGVKWESPSLVDSVEKLKRLYDEDKWLNNIPLIRWDVLANCFLSYNKRTGLSLAEAVCMQKHAAIRLLERTYEGFSAIKEENNE
jgi:adenine-specific DNA methylase